MSISSIHAFLVHAGKANAPTAPTTGESLPLSGKLFDMLSGIFFAGPDLRDFEITFKYSASGQQQNDCRDLMIAHTNKRDLSTGQAIADRLAGSTDKRSGIGLLFLIVGQHGINTRLLASRFPADAAILAQVNRTGLAVEYLDQVFIRKMSAYKAVMLEHQSPQTGFWSGHATDRQAGGSAENISRYWLDDFLTADFSETPAAGTKRLADALKKAAKIHPDLAVKSEIAHAVSLAPSIFKSKSISIDSFIKHFGLSDKTKDAILKQLPKPALSSKTFAFDEGEFKSRVPYRTVEVENGAILTARSEDFEDVFKIEPKGGGVVEFKTEGRISDQRMVRK